jgi:hypothetical protein
MNKILIYKMMRNGIEKESSIKKELKTKQITIKRIRIKSKIKMK